MPQAERMHNFLIKVRDREKSSADAGCLAEQDPDDGAGYKYGCNISQKSESGIIVGLRSRISAASSIFILPGCIDLLK
jgi:hypothetical protein